LAVAAFVALPQLFFKIFLPALQVSPDFAAYVSGGGKKKPNGNCDGVPAQFAKSLLTACNQQRPLKLQSFKCH